MTARASHILAKLLPHKTKQKFLLWHCIDTSTARSPCSSPTTAATVDQARLFCNLVMRPGPKMRGIPSSGQVTTPTAATTTKCVCISVARRPAEPCCQPLARYMQDRTARRTNRRFLAWKQSVQRIKMDGLNTISMRTVCTSTGLQSQQSIQENAERVMTEQEQDQARTVSEAAAAAKAEFIAFIEGLPPLRHPENLKTIIVSSPADISKNITAMISSGETVFGLDIEWQPQFRKGAKENKTGLIQICNSNTALLIQVHRLKYLPKALVDFLQEKRLLKSGVNIRGDGRKLARDFGVECNGFIDLGTVCKHLHPEETRMSLRSLTGSYLGYKMDKNKRVVLSNWSSFRLSAAQIKYASLDAYASYKLCAVFCDALENLGATSEQFVMSSIIPETTIQESNNIRSSDQNVKKSARPFLAYSSETVTKKAVAVAENVSA